MFLDFYGLREQPFGMTPDLAYLYASQTHADALASISLGIKDNRGFLALIAEPGMGKTTLLYQVLEELRDSARTVLVFQTLCNSREFLDYILNDLGVETQGMGLVAMHNKLNVVLFEELLAGKRFVLVVDEAQNLDESVLETVRMLSNFETHNTKLLQIILAGQPRLALKLAQPRMSQLRQRIAVLSHLEPFSAEETGKYIDHRLKVAGYCGEPLFEADAVSLIAQHSAGIPRNINNISYNSLLISHKLGSRTVAPEAVRQAVSRLDIESLAPSAALEIDSPGAPIPSAAPLKIPEPVSIPIEDPVARSVQTKPPLTYSARPQASTPRWRLRSAIFAGVLLSATSVPAILTHSAANREKAVPMVESSPAANDDSSPIDASGHTAASYDAAPQDTEGGQVLTVMAAPQQSLKDLSLRYVGHFDKELSRKILSLNPTLTNPDHLEAGELIRIPLPAGAMKKANDTADAVVAAKPSEGLFTRLTALLRDRR